MRGGTELEEGYIHRVQRVGKRKMLGLRLHGHSYDSRHADGCRRYLQRVAKELSRR